MPENEITERTEVVTFDSIVKRKSYFVSFPNNNIDISNRYREPGEVSSETYQIQEAVKDAYFRKNNSKIKMILINFISKIFREDKYAYLGKEIKGLDSGINSIKYVAGLSELLVQRDGTLKNELNFRPGEESIDDRFQKFSDDLSMLLDKYDIVGAVKLEIRQPPNVFKYLS